MDKYHLYLCVIKTEEADKFLARNFWGPKVTKYPFATKFQSDLDT